MPKASETYQNSSGASMLFFWVHVCGGGGDLGEVMGMVVDVRQSIYLQVQYFGQVENQVRMKQLSHQWNDENLWFAKIVKELPREKII